MREGPAAMHEMSIVEGILEGPQRELRARQGASIRTVRVRASATFDWSSRRAWNSVIAPPPATRLSRSPVWWSNKRLPRRDARGATPNLMSRTHGSSARTVGLRARNWSAETNSSWPASTWKPASIDNLSGPSVGADKVSQSASNAGALLTLQNATWQRLSHRPCSWHRRC